MAPITATTTGIPKQTIDDPKLEDLIERISSFYNAPTQASSALAKADIANDPGNLHSPINIPGLVRELSYHPTWRFQEQADLYVWIKALDAIDAALTQLVTSHPGLILIGDEVGKFVTSLEEVNSVPQSVLSEVKTILRFLSSFLRNATSSKSIFNSVDVIVQLLGAADDTIANLAIELLANLASPPLAHHQQTTEVNPHTNQSLSSHASAHTKIMSIARGWGSRGSGLGLHACVSADDSSLGQGLLPAHAGELTFDYYDDSHRTRTIHLDSQQILCSTSPKLAHPTSHLFFSCMEQVDKRQNIPSDKLFSLLSQIRLVKDFHTKETRSNAVQRRLRAIICALYVHPSQEVLSGYFQAQPELCVEMIDLLKPTISSESVSSAPLSSSVNNDSLKNTSLAAISMIASSTDIPYEIKMIAIESLTALVCRRDGSNGGIASRYVHVLQEIGVGKGQYLGFLPTLIRYSLASLNSFLSTESAKEEEMDVDKPVKTDDFSIDLGFAFVNTVKAPSLPIVQQIERGLEFIELVLTLTAAVITVPNGSASLTDCGLIPALVSTLALHSRISVSRNTTHYIQKESYIDCLLNYISAQAIQIIDGAIATHSSALSVFHELKGMDLLVSRLHEEIKAVIREGSYSDSSGNSNEDMSDIDVSKDEHTDQLNIQSLEKNKNSNVSKREIRPLRASRRVLMYCLISCITVVLHQQESTSSTPSGGAQLRKQELTESLKDIMNHVESYGGTLAALTATLLSDVMNSDPQVVHHVHSSGLSTSFLSMISSKRNQSTTSDALELDYPSLPLTSELVVALPNVLSALALTEDGAKFLNKKNPFPSLLAIFHCPEYVMPQSNCLLNDLSAIVGSGLDELMRHVPSLRKHGIQALVDAINSVISKGESLLKDEIDLYKYTEKSTHDTIHLSEKLNNDRTCIIQYVYNICQLLEQILHNEVLVNPFVEAGGLESLIKLYPVVMSCSSQFLSHISCLSNPASANITHSTTSNAITITIKCIASNYDSQKIIKKLSRSLDNQLEKLFEQQKVLQDAFANSSKENKVDRLNLRGILENVPNCALHELENTAENMTLQESLASFLREIVVTEWLVTILSSVIRTASQICNDLGSRWTGSNRDVWKKEICSDSFSELMTNLSRLHCSAIFEACRVRTEDKFNEYEMKKKISVHDSTPFSNRYLLRIVCQEGAVVRDGIDIDSCSSVGSLQMGEIVEAYDRCINSSGVMRYRTPRGWVSEQTRGHGREPIAEVISIKFNKNFDFKEEFIDKDKKDLKRIEWGIPSLRAASASVFGRLQNSQKTLLACLSRIVIQSMRSLASRSLPTPLGTASTAYAGTIIRLLTSHINLSFESDLVEDYLTSNENFESTQPEKMLRPSINNAGMSLYLGNALELLYVCLYEEKRERRTLNIPLLISILKRDNKSDRLENSNTSKPLPTIGIFGGIRFILKYSLLDMAIHAKKLKNRNKDSNDAIQFQNERLSKAVAASLPPTINILTRLLSRALIVDSQTSANLARLNPTDLSSLFGEESKNSFGFNNARSFVAGKLARELHVAIFDVILEVWANPELCAAPAHVIHPILSLIREVLISLEEGKKPMAPENSSGRTGLGWTSGNMNDGSSRTVSDLQDRVRVLRSLSESMSVFFGVSRSSRTSPSNAASNTSFEPSETTLQRLTEMGFNREHALEALESTESNSLEVAMEYALAHPPSSPSTLERRQRAREERRRQRERASTTSRLRINAAPSALDSLHTLTNPDTRSGSNETLSNPMHDMDNGTNENSQQPSSDSFDTSNNHSSNMDIDVGEEENSNNLPSASESDKKPPAPSPPTKEMTEAERHEKMLKDIELRAISNVQSCITSLRGKIHTVALTLVERGSSGMKDHEEKESSESNSLTGSKTADMKETLANGEAEVLTTVICHFLLELCGRYPSDRTNLINMLIVRLKSHINTSGSVSSVIRGHESEFAALCHTSVILLRALPRTRGLFLVHGMIGMLISCVRSSLSSKDDRFTWPQWIPSVLLLLDIFAQPTAAAIECDDNEKDKISVESGSSGSFRKSEYARACAERKKYSILVSKSAKEIFAIINGNQVLSGSKKKGHKEQVKDKNGSKVAGKKGKHMDAISKKSKNDTNDSNVKREESSVDSKEGLPPIPIYTSLLPQEESEACLSLCLRLLRIRPKSSPSSGDKAESQMPPPGLVHACLLLLARILRSHKIASDFLRMGGTELLFSLPHQSRFVGNTSLVGVILRHMLEDESTLRTSMETEIRTTVARLHRQQNRDLSSRATPKVKASSFIQAVIPLICRDSIVFLQAAATSVSVDREGNESENHQLSKNSARIVLLSAEERAKKVRLLSDNYSNHNSSTNNLTHINNTSKCGTKSSHPGTSMKILSPSGTPNLKRSRTRSSSDNKTPKTKSPHNMSGKRGTTPKRSKKEKHEKTAMSSQHSNSGNFIILNGSATNHIVSRILTDLIKVADKEKQKWKVASSDAVSFLRASDYLEILADLVLAVPACAAAIHRYRPNLFFGLTSSKQHRNPLIHIQHALHGCPNPSLTAVNFLIHVLLPQVRQNISNETESEFEKSNNGKNKKICLIKTKLAQSTSRLLVALCARAGEGRMRVVSDLAYALGGKGFQHAKNSLSHTSPVIKNEEQDKEMWALLSWAELCIGLAAPRSSSINQDSDSVLSFQVVKLMLEHGMGHAIMHGIGRINLHHPMASIVASALLRPMEVLTRSSVTAKVEKMAKLEDSEKKDIDKKGLRSGEYDLSGKDKNEKKGCNSGSLMRRLTIGPSQRSESSFADDDMLEDGFDPDTAERAQQDARWNARRMDSRHIQRFARLTEEDVDFQNVEDDVEHDDDDDDDVEMEVLEEVSDTDDDDMMSTDDDDIDDMDDIDEGNEANANEIEVRLNVGESDVEGSNNSDSSDSEDMDDESENTSSSESHESIITDDSENDVQNEDGDEIEEENQENIVDFGWEDMENDFFENNSGIDDGEEVGIGSDGDLEEGWTRIDSSGIRGVVIGTRQSSESGVDSDGQGRRNLRRRFVIDRPDDAMLGSIREILHSSDMQMEALAEIEDHLGIRIMNAQRSSTGNTAEQRQRRTSRPSSVEENENDVNTRDRGAVGTLPTIQQSNALLDSGQLLAYVSGGRWTENSSMEYTYGPGMIQNEHMLRYTSNDDSRDIDSINMPATMESHLFPGGTATAMHSRVRHRIHPLLSDVELPPIHSVITVSEPHEVRATRSSRNIDARSSDMSISSFVATGGFLSSSNGNIIRLNRGPSGSSLVDHNWPRRGTNASNSETRWTDDGQLLDSTSRDFALAFERVLRETIASEHDNSSRGNQGPASDDATRISSNATAGVEAGDENATDNVEGRALGTIGEDTSQINNERESVQTGIVDHSESRQVVNQELNSNNNSTADTLEGSSSNSNAEASLSEGERVASSLAAGLRLSPRRESSSGTAVSSNQSTSQSNNEPANNTQRSQSENVEMDGAQRSQDDMQIVESGENTNPNIERETTNDESTQQESAPIMSSSESNANSNVNANGLTCPPGMDIDVFNSLPLDLQQEIVEQHQVNLMNVMERLDSSSGLDPEALAALPEEMQREAIAQEQQERQREQAAPANPSNAEEMDNASFVASLSSPALREEVLLDADDSFLNSLPPDIIAEAQILRERASSQHRGTSRAISQNAVSNTTSRQVLSRIQPNSNPQNAILSNKRRNRTGKIKVESDKRDIIYMSSNVKEEFGPLLTESSMKSLLNFLYLLTPIRPKRLMQKLVLNLCTNYLHRKAFLTTFVSLLNNDTKNALMGVNMMNTLQTSKAKGLVTEKSNDTKTKKNATSSQNISTKAADEFPPFMLIGSAPDVSENKTMNLGMFRRRHGNTTVAAIAANLPSSSRGSKQGKILPPEVAKRVLEILGSLSKSPRICVSMLVDYGSDGDNEYSQGLNCLEWLLNLLNNPLYSKSSTNLEQVLNLLESIVAPLGNLPKLPDKEMEISKKDLDTAAAAGKEWISVPQPHVSHQRLKSLCSVLRLETCKDSSFQKVNVIAKRLCRVQENRSCILRELAFVAQGLGADSIQDLKLLGLRLADAAKKVSASTNLNSMEMIDISSNRENKPTERSMAGSAVALSTSKNELKLLRVLQTLQSLCVENGDDSNERKNEGRVFVTQEMLTLTKSIDLGSLWDELSSCLRLVSVLEGVIDTVSEDERVNDSDGGLEESQKTQDLTKPRAKMLQNSAAGLLTRFLPTIESFFLVNASSLSDVHEYDMKAEKDEMNILAEDILNKKNDRCFNTLIGGEKLVNFASTNKVLLNALLRANPSLLEKGLHAMVHVSQCRPFLDFDVKRQWFKTQLRRQRQHSNRRYGTLRLNIRRKYVFEDTYHQLRHRYADEMKGRLHITFRNEEGVDAGGLSREFFGILAKEMFNPNYALFTSTEDGCTFQPNPNSNINPEHLSYFRCVGRIVGKAVLDGFLMDAHFTRSLYKHMLGVKPTHHDMQAIDPDFYKNLKMILEYNLNDIGLDHLTFSTEDHSFGRSQTIDLIPNGRNVSVSEENKEKYVRLVCQHRMTSAIEKQIKAYLEGFYELIQPELIAIFTAKELELLISGMPDIDMHDLRNNTDYQGYKSTDKEIGWFWNIMFSLKRSEKAAFLQFATGSAKVPLEGFAQLQGMRGTQKFTIHKAGGPSGALMSAHTCFNALDLPVYKSEEEMREKLMYAITEGAGGFMFA